MTDAEFEALCKRLVLLPVATAENMHDLRLLVDEAVRGRELERACRAFFTLNGEGGAYCPDCNPLPSETAGLDAIGRLLEGER